MIGTLDVGFRREAEAQCKAEADTYAAYLILLLALTARNNIAKKDTLKPSMRSASQPRSVFLALRRVQHYNNLDARLYKSKLFRCAK